MFKMKEFNKKIQAKFDEMSKTGKLFRVAMTGDEIWKLYLGSFSEEDDPIFRDPNSTSHNCNHCNNFIRRYGNIVSINENFEITTMFDVVADDEFKNTVIVLSNAIRNSKITEVFLETFNELNSLPYESCTKTNEKFQLGVASNPKRYTKEEAEKFGVVKPNELRVFNHFHLFVQKEYVDSSGASVEALMGNYRDAKNVFQRAMETISLDTLHLVRDLINQGSLLDGTTHLYKVEQMIPLKQEYDNLAANQRDNWCWVKSYKMPFAKFRNELIGVLCSELSEGEELNKACQSWNKRVDPANYMKVTAPITKKQIEEAKKFVEENGYTESFNRRFANIDDIKVSEILHSNVGSGEIKSISIFDSVKSTSTRHKRNEFDGVETVTIDKFMKDILPTCSSVEAFLANNHQGNLVSLTTSKIEDSKPIFKWSNNYSWTFNGNLAGKSQIKEAVKTAGGRVDGVLRFSMIWNEVGDDNSDLDAWCTQPDKQQIGYSAGFRKDSGNRLSSCSGQLDLDNTSPNGKLAIENIYFSELKKMKDGVYKFVVHQFAARNSQGFKAEIEFDGETFLYEYNKPVSGAIGIADVVLKDGKFSITHLIPESSVSSKEIYGLETNQFHKVNLVCLSPNHWGENNVGNKHYFFMLDGCKSPTSIRSFHNENLLPELAAHRKVLEVLGTTNMIEPTDNKSQLSGLGFNATVREELIVRVQGSHKRVLKIQF
jgi:hypothetical protein